MLLTEHLVQGVDVWINTPRRPWEACGTSGLKVLVNGGINLSELDGWWAEAYTPEVGWALGDGQEHGDGPAWDAVEADARARVEQAPLRQRSEEATRCVAKCSGIERGSVMRAEIIRIIERRQAGLSKDQRFDMEPKKRFNKTRQKQPSAEEQAACRKYIGGPRSVMGREFGNRSEK
jgi:glucan phosphorylase